jgi:hypothetical protein
LGDATGRLSDVRRRLRLADGRFHVVAGGACYLRAFISMVRTFEGRIAVVIDGGTPRGRAFALALAARGARVVVAGASERALAETVGEIAASGGTARHSVGGVDAALARATALWGPADVLVETGLDLTPREPR